MDIKWCSKRIIKVVLKYSDVLKLDVERVECEIQTFSDFQGR